MRRGAGWPMNLRDGDFGPLTLVQYVEHVPLLPHPRNAMTTVFLGSVVRTPSPETDYERVVITHSSLAIVTSPMPSYTLVK